MKVLRPDDIHPSSARLWLWVGRRSCDRWRALQGGHRVAPQDLDDNTGDAETGAECKDIMVYYVGRVYQTQNILCRESVSECIGIGECEGATAGRWLWPYASLSRGAACALDLWLASGLTSSISSKRGEKYVEPSLISLMIKYKSKRKQKKRKRKYIRKKKQTKIWEGMGGKNNHYTIYVRYMYSILVKAAAPCFTFKISSLK